MLRRLPDELLKIIYDLLKDDESRKDLLRVDKSTYRLFCTTSYTMTDDGRDCFRIFLCMFRVG